MIFILEAMDYYKDTWMITFYFVAALALMIGFIWTFIQYFGKNKKEPLKENVIYNHEEDVFEKYDIELDKKKENLPKNNYQLKDYNLIKRSYIELTDDDKQESKYTDLNEIKNKKKNVIKKEKALKRK